MTRDVSSRDRLASPVVLFYWLLMLGGLAVYTAIRKDELAEVVPLWAGAVAGTALGQLLALRDLRLWLTAVVVALVPLLMQPLVPLALEHHLWTAFVPAALCGYMALSDRFGLAAFWFPAVLWMLSILEHVNTDAGSLREGLDGESLLLLGGLAVLFLAFLRAREYRRVGLWRAVSAGPLSTVGQSEVLREAPGRMLARGAWIAMVGGLTFGLTAWVAPHLWQGEKLTVGDATGVGTESLFAEGSVLPCCPFAEVRRSRVREYFDLVRGHDDEPLPGLDCQACDASGARLVGGIGTASITTENTNGPPTRVVPAALTAPTAPPLAPPVAAPTQEAPVAETLAPHQPECAAPRLPPPPAPQIAPPTLPPAHAIAALRPPAPVGARHATHAAARSSSRDSIPNLFGWLLTLVAALLLSQALNFALRPLRRMIVLRHLRRPFWPESVDQRVSNLWQLALVGLRDAGWRSTASEAPREFAHRVGIVGLEACATVLERSRHGLSVDAGDLAEMRASADSAYATARRRIGLFAGIVASLRWPLA